MPRSLINRRSKTWGREKKSTGEASLAFGSTSKRLGQKAEDQVLALLQRQTYKLIQRNKKWCGVELDLFMFKNHYHIFEVKRLRDIDEVHFRVSPKQIKRLLYARHSLEDHMKELVELHFAFVVQTEIYILPYETFVV